MGYVSLRDAVCFCLGVTLGNSAPLVGCTAALSRNTCKMGTQLLHMSLHQKCLTRLCAGWRSELLYLAAGLGKREACHSCRQRQWGTRDQSADLRQEPARQRLPKPQVHELQAAALTGGEVLSPPKAPHAMALQLQLAGRCCEFSGIDPPPSSVHRSPFMRAFACCSQMPHCLALRRAWRPQRRRAVPA